MRARDLASCGMAITLGCGLAIAGVELPYVNWRSVASPIDAHPLILRHDAKGDGRFLAPRSGRRRHRGIDLATPLHSPVRAIRSGWVVEVGFHPGLGRFVELEHREHLRSLYAHLSQVSVEAGARVRQGEAIGTVGKTGNARSAWITPHLHLEVLRDGQPLDPQTLGLQVVDLSIPMGEARAVSTVEQRPGESEFEDASGGE